MALLKIYVLKLYGKPCKLSILSGALGANHEYKIMSGALGANTEYTIILYGTHNCFFYKRNKEYCSYCMKACEYMSIIDLENG